MRQTQHTAFSPEHIAFIDDQITLVLTWLVRIVIALFLGMMAVAAGICACILVGLFVSAKGLHVLLVLIALFLATRPVHKAALSY